MGLPAPPPELDTGYCPLAMGSDERAIRAGLYAAWWRSAGEFRLALKIARDYFEERSMWADVAVCRAEWEPCNCYKDDPGRWWCWRVWLPPDVTASMERWTNRNAGIEGRKHNGAVETTAKRERNYP